MALGLALNRTAETATGGHASSLSIAHQRRCVEALGMQQVVSAPRSPWQNAFVERVIGTIRRECTDHIIPWNERHLIKVLREYVEHYNEGRCHQSLDGNSPVPREKGGRGDVVSKQVLGGLHHEYSRVA
jgi:putative transposase